MDIFAGEGIHNESDKTPIFRVIPPGHCPVLQTPASIFLCAPPTKANSLPWVATCLRECHSTSKKSRLMQRRQFVIATATGTAGLAVGGVAGRASSNAGLGIASFEGRMSYSQQGEDLIIHDLLRIAMKIDKPVYLDIGAADPVAVNNTYLLYQTGTHGVLVEPNPYYVERLKQRRPNDTVVAAGVGVDDAQEADYYVMREHPMLNTFSRDDVAIRQKSHPESVVEKTLKMRLIQINHLIETYLGGKAPDLLSIDIEGLDFAVLQTLDFERYRPAVICAETCLMVKPGVNSETVNLLTSKGYVVHGATRYNTIFADPARCA